MKNICTNEVKRLKLVTHDKENIALFQNSSLRKESCRLKMLEKENRKLKEELGKAWELIAHLKQKCIS